MNFTKVAIFFTATVFCVHAAVTADAKVASAERLTNALQALASSSSPQAQKLAQGLKSFKMPSQEQMDLLAEKLRSVDMPSKEKIDQVAQALRSGHLSPALRKLALADTSSIATTSRTVDTLDPELIAILIFILKFFGVDFLDIFG